MATHSGVLAWRIPGMGEPRGLPSMGLYRVGHDWSDLAAAAAAEPSWDGEIKKNLFLLCFCSMFSSQEKKMRWINFITKPHTSVYGQREVCWAEME